MKNDALTSPVETIKSRCLAVRIRLLNRTITKIFNEALRPLGVKVNQLNVLMVVAKHEPISPGDVSRRLNMEKSTMSRNIDRMRTRGWLNVSDGHSPRTQILKLSSAGRKMIERSLPFWEKAQAKTESMLGQQGARSIHRMANTLP